MDFWASLEHKLKYKKEIECTDEIMAELKQCAEESAALDVKMQNLHNKMKRDNFTESDLAEIAEALNCDLKIQFISKETGEVL